MTTVYMRDVTGIPPVPTRRPRLSAQERREFRQRECEKVASNLAVYEGDDIFIDMRGCGSLHDTSVLWMRKKMYGGAPEVKDRLRVTEHLVRQWQIHRNHKFAIIRHDDGRLLAVSLAEFIGLGKPEADTRISDASPRGWLSRPLVDNS